MGTIWIARLREVSLRDLTTRFGRALWSFCLRAIASHLIGRMIMLLLSDHLTLYPLPWMVATNPAPSAAFEAVAVEPAFRYGPVVCCWARPGEARRLEAFWRRR